MNTKDLLLQEIEQVPEPILEEVLDFLRFLKAKEILQRQEATFLSEPSLAKDWLRPEEEEAWRDL
ncbi:MAG: DUF2281 domain-containing protein [Chroococcidiopsis sp.]